MYQSAKLGLTVVASPLEVGAGDADELLSLESRTLQEFGRPGLEILPTADPVIDASSAVQAGRYFYEQRVDAICALAASWFEDYLVLDMLEECPVPFIGWSRPGMETGSLCGMQQLGFILRQLGRSYTLLFDDVHSTTASNRIWDMTRAAALRSALRRARIGLLGHRVEGMTDTTAPELLLKRIFGPRIIGLDSRTFLEQVAQVPSDEVAGAWRMVKGKVGTVNVSDEDGIASLRTWYVLRERIAALGLAAVAVGCYPDLMGHVCLAASLLGEEGVPVACEGDVNGALAMLILMCLSGGPVHNTDLLDPIPGDNAIVFSHCGSGSFSLAVSPDNITLAPVRLVGKGVCCTFPARPGIVTLLHVSPTPQGYRMAILYGEALETNMVFPGNPLRVHFEMPYRDILDWIACEGLGHHWMAAYGDLRRPLRDLAALAGCECVVTG